MVRMVTTASLTLVLPLEILEIKLMSWAMISAVLIFGFGGGSRFDAYNTVREMGLRGACWLMNDVEFD